MELEIEAKFLDVDHEAVRMNLRRLGATCTAPFRLMKRAIIDYPDKKLQKGVSNSYIRIRNEGNKVTLTFKQFKSLSVDGAQEITTEVSSFEDTIAIFNAIGLETVSIQESKRETWELDGCEIALDEWPWLKPYIEIEGTSEGALKSLAKKMGFVWNDAVFGDVMVAYRAQYPSLTDDQTIGNLPEVLFGSSPPEFLQG